jgi:hypothetical protein
VQMAAGHIGSPSRYLHSRSSTTYVNRCFTPPTPIFFSLATLRRLSGNFDQRKWEREFRRLMATLEKDSGPQNPAITRERQPPAQKPRAKAFPGAHVLWGVRAGRSLRNSLFFSVFAFP